MTQYIPNEIEDGKLMGIMPMQYGRVSYQFSQPISGASRETIFRQSRRWAAFHLSNPSNSLAVSDNILGDVIVSGRINARLAKVFNRNIQMPAVTYATSIESYEGRYRVTVTNLQISPTPLITYPIELRIKGNGKATARQILFAVHKDINDLLTDLEKFVPAEAAEKQ